MTTARCFCVSVVSHNVKVNKLFIFQCSNCIIFILFVMVWICRQFIWGKDWNWQWGCLGVSTINITNTSQVRTSTWRCEAACLQYISTKSSYTAVNWYVISWYSQTRNCLVSTVACSTFWLTMKVLSSHLPMWTVRSCWHIWLVTCIYQCNDKKPYVLSARKVLYNKWMEVSLAVTLREKTFLL